MKNSGKVCQSNSGRVGSSSPSAQSNSSLVLRGRVKASLFALDSPLVGGAFSFFHMVGVQLVSSSFPQMLVSRLGLRVLKNLHIGGVDDDDSSGDGFRWPSFWSNLQFYSLTLLAKASRKRSTAGAVEAIDGPTMAGRGRLQTRPWPATDARTKKTFAEGVRKGDMYVIEEAPKVSNSCVSDLSFSSHSEVNIIEAPAAAPASHRLLIGVSRRLIGVSCRRPTVAHIAAARLLLTSPRRSRLPSAPHLAARLTSPRRPSAPHLPSPVTAARCRSTPPVVASLLLWRPSPALCRPPPSLCANLLARALGLPITVALNLLSLPTVLLCLHPACLRATACVVFCSVIMRFRRFRRCSSPTAAACSSPAAVCSSAVAGVSSTAVAGVSSTAAAHSRVAGVIVAVTAVFLLSSSPSPPVFSPPPLPLVCPMTPKIDDALDTGSNTKSENLPVQVTSIRLNKDNYLSWSAALEIGITSRGRLSYITGEKLAPSKTDPRWATWALEDSQVKVWIISFVSADIQPLILRKSTACDMWTMLARMYGHKKRVLRTYQIKRSIYALKQGDLSIASYFAALKTKWEELDYHVNDDWHCGSDHALYWDKEWMDRTFIFLGGLRDEFEPIRSQILNCDEIPGIEEGQDSALLDSVAIATNWDILLIFVGIFIQRSVLSGVVLLLVGGVLRCLSLVRVTQSEMIETVTWTGLADNQPTARDHLFGQVYERKKTDVVENVDVSNPNPASSPDDPSLINEELPRALRKGTKSCTPHPIQRFVSYAKLSTPPKEEYPHSTGTGTGMPMGAPLTRSMRYQGWAIVGIQKTPSKPREEDCASDAWGLHLLECRPWWSSNRSYTCARLDRYSKWLGTGELGLRYYQLFVQGASSQNIMLGRGLLWLHSWGPKRWGMLKTEVDQARSSIGCGLRIGCGPLLCSASYWLLALALAPTVHANISGRACTYGVTSSRAATVTFTAVVISMVIGDLGSSCASCWCVQKAISHEGLDLLAMKHAEQDEEDEGSAKRDRGKIDLEDLLGFWAAVTARLWQAINNGPDWRRAMGIGENRRGSHRSQSRSLVAALNVNMVEHVEVVHVWPVIPLRYTGELGLRYYQPLDQGASYQNIMPGRALLRLHAWGSERSRLLKTKGQIRQAAGKQVAMAATDAVEKRLH
ncbi:hypothetical protein EJ110_NYTH44756 [Nymphaea thermarum]|nr:hypothetical protein EJ110_NYTH44756 [Nymphaea thermarum]